MHFTPPLRANSELGDTLEPFLRQPHLTSSHTLTSKSHHPLQFFPFHVIQLLLLLLDFETNFVAGNKNQQKSTERHSTSTTKISFATETEKLLARCEQQIYLECS